MSGAPVLQDHNSTTFTSGSLLARNTVYNLIGQGLPMLVALFAVPLLINGLGTERFGVLTLAWMVIGYFSLFDLGLGRALTKMVAEKLGVGRVQEIPALVWTTQFLMILLGLLGTLVVSLLSPWLVGKVLKIPEALQSETLHTFYLLALSIPVTISISGLRGVLEAHQRFKLINAIRIPMGIFTFLGPLSVLPFSQSLFLAVAVLVAGRLLAWLLHLLFCFYTMPALRHGVVLQRALTGPLIRFGSLMTVTNIIGPLMVYLDRFLIGSMISVTAVAYYATPYEVVTKLWLIPVALASVLFPAFSASLAQDRNRAALLFSRGVRYIFLSLFPIILLIITLAHEGLTLWLGAEFAQNSTRVLQWLAVGVFFNSLAQIPFALVQGAGRPDLTAKLHLIELPFYLLAVWWLIGAYGIEGAAVAWVARIVVDTLILFGMAHRFLSSSVPITQFVAFTFGAILLILPPAVLPMSIAMKGLFLFLTLLAFALITWLLILAPGERSFALNYLKIAQVILTGEVNHDKSKKQ
ncbi:MAG: flippase [Thermodesulfovibrionales bacterium]|nr:flippase [Thermodesulfovibrionales bacterium]